MSEDHYFSADPAVPFTREPLVAEVWGRRLALTSGSGVFARGRLDGGPAVLFRETEPPTGGRILDLGCGYGVIGLAIAACSPDAVVTGVDVNQRAVLLATENAASLGVSDRYGGRGGPRSGPRPAGRRARSSCPEVFHRDVVPRNRPG